MKSNGLNKVPPIGSFWYFSSMTEQFDAELQELLNKIKQLEQQQQQNHQQLELLKNEVRAYLRSTQPAGHAALQDSAAKTNKNFSMEQFIGLKLLNFIGIVVLLIGIAIGVKLAIDKNLISPLLRITLAYISGGTLLALSIFLHRKYQAFSAVLFSGAMATFYFTTYGAYDFYALILRPFAFSLMVAFTIFTVWVSLRETRQEIAILGLVGAYGIPFLVGSNSGNIAALFSYIFIINSGILFISFRKEWDWLKILSFSFSWIILLSWLVIKYDFSRYSTGILFSILFFLQFTITICGFHILRKRVLSAADYVFIAVLSFFVYMALLLLYKNNHVEGVFAGVTLATAAVHIILAFVVYFLLHAYRLLSYFYVYIAIFLLILYVPLRFEGITISFSWIAMAVALFITGFWLKTRTPRFISIALFAVTLIKLVIVDSMNFTTVEKIITYSSIGILLLIISFLYQKYRQLLFGKDE